ncbi:AMP-binding protein [Conexibacter sp. W3-3-2]|uniref:AMP-binding protein n=1 Tax=Conexibacter sp. W3-3-2 TaxID=2675227 RepID=UPI0012B867E8|nr:AMP-binding protein [Conexibacter sp. W3-3-2]MTD47107.1 AMP-binding protein [Conexibacter sp. W3-3-2]
MAQPRPGTLEALAAAAPDQVVLREHGSGRTRTRAAWDEQAGALAAVLADRHGVGHGARVAILLARPRLELLDLVLALAKLGAVPVLLPPGADPAPADPAVVFAAAGDGPPTGALTLEEDLPALVAGAPAGTRPLSGFRTAPRTVLATAGMPTRLLERDDTHTDATALATVAGDLLVRAGHRQGRGHLLAAAPWLPATLLHANVAALAGGELTIVPSGRPQDWLDALGTHEPGTAVLTPADLAAILALPAATLEAADTTALDALLVAGDHLPLPHRLAAADLLGEESVAPLYATAELGPVALLHREALTADPGTAGLPLQGVEVTVRGPDGTAVGRGTVGRIDARSPLRAGPADATSGDLGLRDEDGRLVVLGRRWDGWTDDDGRPVGPLRAQDAALGDPAVAAAVATADALLVQAAADATPDPGALADRVRATCGADAARDLEVRVVARLARDPLGRPVSA